MKPMRVLVAVCDATNNLNAWAHVYDVGRPLARTGSKRPSRRSRSTTSWTAFSDRLHATASCLTDASPHNNAHAAREARDSVSSAFHVESKISDSPVPF